MIALALVALAGGDARAQPADIAGVDPCERARNLAGKDAEPGLVELYYQLCEASGGATDSDRAAHRKLAAGLTRSHATVTVEVAPAVDGAVGFVDVLGKVPFALPGQVFVPPGTHQVAAIAPGHHGAARQVTIGAGDVAGVPLTLEPVSPDETRRDDAVDFAEEGEAGSVTHATDLPDAEHDQLLPDRFARGVNARGGGPVTVPEKRYRLGLGVGLTAADVTGDSDVDGRLGIGAAAIARYRVRGGLHAEAELGYTPHGTDPAGIDYLTIPVRIGYAIAAGPVELQVGAGPAVGIAVASDDGIDPRPIDVGLSGNLALLIPAGPGLVRIDYAIFAGVTEIADGADARNLSSSLRAGYLF